MKRQASKAATGSPAKKKPRPEVPDYVNVPLIKDEHGGIVWPAPTAQMEHAREIILECSKAGKRTIIVPDKDADGLTSGVILYRTLRCLGLADNLISVHLLEKGQTIHCDAERARMSACSPAYVFVLDQGSRESGPVVDNVHTALIIDHHFATETDFPSGSVHVTACDTPPVATSALLTYTLCQPLHEDVATQCDWLCVVGTMGDLGNSFSWSHPFPDMSAPLKKYTKSTLNKVVSAVNAPRRTASFDVEVAWNALMTANVPSKVLSHSRLAEARAEVSEEVERCTHTAPSFSPDGRIAVFRIKSKAQIHPIIATRWAGHLNSKALEIVMVANEGYLENKVNFSCRVARCAKTRDPPVNIIESLKEYASQSRPADGSDADQVPLLHRLGTDFARGHTQASGGIVSHQDFEELIALMRIGEKSDAQRAKQAQKELDKKPTQKNTLANYFSSPGKTAKS